MNTSVKTCPLPLITFAILVAAGCDAEEPISLLDVEVPIEEATTGEVDPLEIDEATEEALALDSLVESVEPDPVADFPMDELDLKAENDPSELNPLGYWSWGTPGNNGGRYYLGSAANRTCFLQGVTGELQSAANASSARAGVYIDGNTNQWYIETRAGTPEFWGDGGSGVMAHVTCIPNTSNRQIISWVGNSQNGSNTLYSFAEDHGNTRCFMTAVSGTVGWASANSYARLRRGTRNGQPTWELGGNLLTEIDGDSGGGAAAVCVDVNFQVTGTYSWNSSTQNSTQLTSTTSGVTCAVHRLSGNFAANPYGWNDGTRIYPVSYSSGDRWHVSATTSKRIAGECYQNMTFSWP